MLGIDAASGSLLEIIRTRSTNFEDRLNRALWLFFGHSDPTAKELKTIFAKLSSVVQQRVLEFLAAYADPISTKTQLDILLRAIVLEDPLDALAGLLCVRGETWVSQTPWLFEKLRPLIIGQFENLSLLTSEHRWLDMARPHLVRMYLHACPGEDGYWGRFENRRWEQYPKHHESILKELMRVLTEMRLEPSTQVLKIQFLASFDPDEGFIALQQLRGRVARIRGPEAQRGLDEPLLAWIARVTRPLTPPGSRPKSQINRSVQVPRSVPAPRSAQTGTGGQPNQRMQ